MRQLSFHCHPSRAPRRGNTGTPPALNDSMSRWTVRSDISSRLAMARPEIGFPDCSIRISDKSRSARMATFLPVYICHVSLLRKQTIRFGDQTMKLNEILSADLKREAEGVRRVLERAPEGRPD